MTKPRCILHIGMPKTGTSSIQTTLSKEKIVKDCEYLNLGSEGNHSTIIYSLFKKQPELHHAHIALKRTKKEVEEYVAINRQNLKQILTSINTKQYIISGEDILFLEEDELLNLKRFFMQFSSNIHVFAYIRPPIAFMQSAFQQKVKEGDLRFGIAGFYPNYRKRFESFDNVFGDNNVFLKKFSSDSLLAGDVVLDFCNWTGISFNNDNITRVNESISLEAMALLYVFYKFCKNDYPIASEINYRLSQEFITFGNRKLKYSKTLIKHIYTMIGDDIQWMEDRLKCSLAESIPDSQEGISSEEDLIAIAFANRDKLSELISQKIGQQLVTPQNIAETVALLRGNHFLKPAFSHAQLSRLESPLVETREMLRELVLSLGRAGHIKAVQNILGIICQLKNSLNESPHDGCSISFSVDMYHNGCLKGWIIDRNNPLNKLRIEFQQGQRIIAQGIADKFRKDLAEAEIGDGCCAFVVTTDTLLKNGRGKLILKVVELNKEFEIDINAIKGIDVA